MRKNQAFIAFAECNRRKLTTSFQVDKITKEIHALNKSAAELESRRKNAKDELHGVQKKLHAMELELKTLDSQESEKKRRVIDTTSAKEYQSLVKEIDQIQEKKSLREEEIFVMWDMLEKAQQRLKEVEQETHEELKRLQDAIVQARYHKETTEKQYDELEKECEEVSRLVNPELLATYRLMLETVPDPAVPIEGGSCSACFYAVPRGDLNRAEQGQIITCKDCYRLLYSITPSSHE